jgi:formylglycine-generating enzyme required for sulfatase activity
MRYLALLLFPALLSAAAPVVSNVRAQQRLGTKLIDVTYDLADSDGGTVYISAQIFDGTTALPAFSLSGHIGAGVIPGTNKAIVWNAGQDWNRQYTTSGKVRIIADDITVTPPSAAMVYVPAGFSVNSYGNHAGSSSAKVFSNGFFMDKTEISKATWDTVRTWALANGYTFDNAGLATDTNHPVVGVSWYDAVKWCNARSEKEGLAPVYFTDANRTTIYKTGTVIVRSTFCNWSADGYRLPTRAEWSKAAWGGSTSGPYYWPSYYGSGSEILNVGQANFFNTYAQRSHQWDLSATTQNSYFAFANYGTTPVGYYNGNQQISGLALGVAVMDMKNGFGLYDMAGNAAEWLWDSYYSEVTATTEYRDDNYKGPDLGLGTERHFAAGRLDTTTSNWDLQSKTSATSNGTSKIIFITDYNTQQSTDGFVALYGQRTPQVGFRTVRGR